MLPRSRGRLRSGSCSFQSSAPAKCRGWRARRPHPCGPPCGGPEKGAASAPARRLVAIRSALRHAGRTGVPREEPAAPPSLPGPIRLPGGFPVGTGPTPLRCATRTAGPNAGGFSGRHPGTAAGPCRDYSRRGFRRRGRRSPPAATGAGSETPPLGRKGRTQCKGGWGSGDNREGYAREASGACSRLPPPTSWPGLSRPSTNLWGPRGARAIPSSPAGASRNKTWMAGTARP